MDRNLALLTTKSNEKEKAVFSCNLEKQGYQEESSFSFSDTKLLNKQ